MLTITGQLLRRQGLRATGTTQILAESKAPRGSLYFHFPGGKEQLAAESLVRSGSELGARMSALLDAAEGPADAVTLLGELFAGELLESDFRDGCPIATVALEAASESAAIHDVCAAVYTAWERGLADRLRGWGVPEAIAGQHASLVFAAIQGALVIARVRRNAELVREVCSFLACTLSTPTDPSSVAVNRPE